MPKSNLAARLLTAGIAGPLLLAILFLGPAWGFSLVVIAATALASYEVLSMTHPSDRVARLLGVLVAIVPAAGLAFAGDDPAVLVGVLVVAPIFGMLLPLVRLGEIATAGLRIMAGAAVPIYVGAPLGLLARMREAGGSEGAGRVLLVLLLAWLADTGGYFFGRFLGKTKLYEAVSPKKTRAGLVGAVVGAVVGALIASQSFLPKLGIPHAITLGVLGGLLGQAGDLTESLLKRSTGVKDSGGVLPGHGGLLDRIDAVLVLSPLVYLYCLCFFDR